MNRVRFMILWLAISSFVSGAGFAMAFALAAHGSAWLAALNAGAAMLNAAVAYHIAHSLAPSIRGVSITLGRG